MMVSTKGRYALRVLIDLAEHQSEGYVPLKEIAQRQEISEKYLESILKILVRSQLLSGMRGKGGGYRLTMPPEDYSVGQVLRLTEDGLAPVSCLEREEVQCSRRDTCHTLPMWKKLDDLINSFLDGISLADLMELPENQCFSFPDR